MVLEWLCLVRCAARVLQIKKLPCKFRSLPILFGVVSFDPYKHYLSNGKTRTLYSLRHTSAKQALLANRTDIHTLARQMGNSAAMIEQHYSKLTVTMAADRLA